MGFLFFFLFLIPVFLVLGVLLSAVFLRAAIALANKIFKPTSVRPRPSINLPTDFLDETPSNETPLANETPVVTNPFAKPIGSAPINKPSDGNPYAAPQSYGSPVKARGAKELAIAEPSFGKACGIVFLHSLAGLVFNVLLSLAPVDPLATSLGGIVLGFLAATLIYGAMLPTTPGRAAAVYLIQLLLMIVVFGGILAVVMAILAFAG